MKLSERDEKLLNGEFGPAAQMAMRILTQLGEVLGADEMLDVERVHVDGCIYESEAHLDFAEKLASLGGRVILPTTLNATSLDLRHPDAWGYSAEWKAKAQRMANAYLAMGCTPTWTCAPYQTEHLPKFGQQIAWAESNAIVYANSVIGARTNRYGDFTDICAALTGRVPKYGLHLTENRRGQILFALRDIPDALFQDDAFYPVLGHYIGKATGDKIPVIDGLPSNVSPDALKALGAGAASSGAVALFHAVGITPEARTLEQAFGGNPYARVEITLRELNAARAELSSADGAQLDAVVLGSPHFSLPECLRLAELIRGQRVHPSVEFIVTTNRMVTEALRARGILQTLLDAGVRLCEDTCILLSPMLRQEIRVLMTNSAKYAYYTPNLLERRVVFGSLRDCVASAVQGRVVREDKLWIHE
jgi:predicted aconitase